MKPIDIHTHILNWQIIPHTLYFAGRDWDMERLTPIIYALTQELDPILDVLEWFYERFTDKDLDADPLAKIYFTPLKEQKKFFSHMPTIPNIMSLDFYDYEKSAPKNNAAIVHAERIASEIGSPWSMGIDPDRYLDLYGRGWKPKGPKALKAYPKMWSRDKTAETAEIAAAWGLPLIIHSLGGGIGQHKFWGMPSHWIDQLEFNPNLRVCFAHAARAGDALINVLEMMAREFRTQDGAPRVFVDTAFCEGAIFSPKRYFNNLRRIMSGPLCDGLLFGSDWPLFTPYGYTIDDLLEAHYKHLGSEIFTLITNYNPRDFLKI